MYSTPLHKIPHINLRRRHHEAYLFPIYPFGRAGRIGKHGHGALESVEEEIYEESRHLAGYGCFKAQAQAFPGVDQRQIGPCR